MGSGKVPIMALCIITEGLVQQETSNCVCGLLISLYPFRINKFHSSDVANNLQFG